MPCNNFVCTCNFRSTRFNDFKPRTRIFRKLINVLYGARLLNVRGQVGRMAAARQGGCSWNNGNKILFWEYCALLSKRACFIDEPIIEHALLELNDTNNFMLLGQLHL